MTENALLLARFFEDYGDRLVFDCPGCGVQHWIDKPGRRWRRTWQHGRPTVVPSIDAAGPPRCHFYITDGVLVFLDDCGANHKLTGQRVPMTIRRT